MMIQDIHIVIIFWKYFKEGLCLGLECLKVGNFNNFFLYLIKQIITTYMMIEKCTQLRAQSDMAQRADNRYHCSLV